jgi:OOP family OmpA-OmpF porin
MDVSRTGAARRTVAGSGATVLLAAVLAGCSTPAEQSCADLFGLPAGDGREVLVVTDATGSAARWALPPVVAEQLEAASRDNGTVSVLAVDGPGALPQWVLRGAALNDGELDPETDRFDRIAELAPGCVEESVQRAAPTVPGSDVLAALQTAADTVSASPDAQVAVLTDGLANAGALDLAQVTAVETPVTEVVAALADGGQLPRFTGQEVGFHGVGQAAAGRLSQPVTEWLRALWTEVCHGSGAVGCSVDAAGAPVAPDRGSDGAPEDPALVLPAAEAVSLDGGCRLRVSAALLFAPDSAQLAPGAAAQLMPAAELLRQPGTRATVTGHTSSFGDPAAQRETSQARADAAAGALVGLGAQPGQLRTVGAGGTDLLVDDRGPDGGLIEAMAQQNRRVEVEVSGVPGCGR